MGKRIDPETYTGTVYIDERDDGCQPHEQRCYEDVVDRLKTMAAEMYPEADIEVCSQSEMSGGIEVDGDMYQSAWSEIDSRSDSVGEWCIYSHFRPDYTQTYARNCDQYWEVGYYHDDEDEDVPGYWYGSDGQRDSERTPITRDEARVLVGPDVWAALPADLADEVVDDDDDDDDDDEADDEAEIENENVTAQ